MAQDTRQYAIEWKLREERFSGQTASAKHMRHTHIYLSIHLRA